MFSFLVHLLPPPKEVICFWFGLFVCLAVYLSDCPSDNWKSCERILTKFLGGVGHGPWTNEFNFGDDPDHRPDPGVRSLKSGFTGLSNYQRILMKFYGELGCGLETNWLHFGDDPHHYPDPGRTGVRRRSVLSEYFQCLLPLFCDEWRLPCDKEIQHKSVDCSPRFTAISTTGMLE